MTDPAIDTLHEESRLGAFRYMAPAAESSLYRNGIALILGAGRMASARSAEAAAHPLGGPAESD